MGSNGINILMAPAYPLAGGPALCGKGFTTSLVSVDQARPWAPALVERALTTGQPAFVTVRKHVLLWSAQERST
jgi:hypothetical protein